MRPIDADAVVEKVEKHRKMLKISRHDRDLVLSYIGIGMVPIIKAVPKKGKWFYQDTMYSCDQCHSQFYDISPFCPNCGADMREQK